MLLSLFTSMPMMVCAVIAIELALEQLRDYNRPRAWLLVWAVVTTTLYAGHYIFFHHVRWLLPWSDTVYVMCNLAVYPLYLIYISELADMRPLAFSKWKVGALICPALIGGLACGILYAMMTPKQTDAFFQIFLYGETFRGLNGLPFAQAVVHKVCQIFFSLEVVGVLTAGAIKVRTFHHQIDLLYADTEGRSLRWVNNILILLMVTSVLSLVMNKLGRHYFEDTLWLGLPSVAFSMVLFVIGWIGLRRRPSAREIMCEYRENNHSTESGALSDADAQINEDQQAYFTEEKTNELVGNNEEMQLPLMSKIKMLVEEQHLYLRNDLKLDDVAQLLGTNRTYLIYALNVGMNMTFKEYINKLRISYAKKLIAENPALTKNEVATLCGYATPSSFYRNWKKYEGVTTINK